jgi:hypothetical protein
VQLLHTARKQYRYSKQRTTAKMPRSEKETGKKKKEK